ncbi:hypothetical protein K491DRAFT_684547 [Lophiostoma macrostomum CBS 122681]|uniref:RING-type domain-containing protein n=1 Tax=Lophiostoma macrostomum CBS 122681 TaxID=1314788 RepID=A0A6A6SLP3_9PLEO|nr:hypothetical protein K491DRAFT_684547 [Lophiostoma macrostomum CBS 122681]
MSSPAISTPLAQVASLLLRFHGMFKPSDELLDVLCAVLVDAYRFASVEGLMMWERLPDYHQDVVLEIFQNALSAPKIDAELRQATVSFDPKHLWNLAYLHIQDIQDPYEPTAGPGSVTRGKQWLILGAIQADATGKLARILPSFLETQPVIQEEPLFGYHHQLEKADIRATDNGPWGLFPGMTHSLNLLQSSLSAPYTEPDKLAIYTLLLQYFQLAMDVADTWTTFYYCNLDSTSARPCEIFPTPRQVTWALERFRWNHEAAVRDPLSPIPLPTRHVMARVDYDGNFRFLCQHVVPDIILRATADAPQGFSMRFLGYYLYRYLWRDCINSLHDHWGFLAVYRQMRAAMGLQVSVDVTRWRPPPYRGPTIEFGAYEWTESERGDVERLFAADEGEGDVNMDTDTDYEVRSRGSRSSEGSRWREDEPRSPVSESSLITESSLWEELEPVPDVELEACGDKRYFEECSHILMETLADVECPFCLEGGEVGSEDIFVAANSCGHAFHLDCLETWLNSVHRVEYVQCPICRAPLCASRDYRSKEQTPVAE